MGAVREGPQTFFRLSPGDCYAVRRGEARSRLDTDYHAPAFRALRVRLAGSKSLATVAELVSAPLVSGFAAGRGNQDDDDPAAVPQLRPTNILPDGSIDFAGAKNIPPTDVDDSDLLQAGEVLFNNTNSLAWVGKSAAFTGDRHAVCSNHVTRLRLNKGLEPRFVAEALNAMQRLGYFRALATNFNNQAGVNTDVLAAVLVPLGDPAERKRLLAELDAARTDRDAKLAASDTALASFDPFILGELGLTLPLEQPLVPYAAKLGQLAEGRLDPFINKPWYGKLLAELEGVDHVPLGTLVGPIVGGATPSRSDASLYAENGTALLRINNIRPNEIDTTDCRFITDNVHAGELARSQLMRGDVLLTITGRVGTAAVYDRDAPANINQHIVRLRLASARVGERYLAAFLNSSFGMAVSNRSVTGATRIALDYDSIRAIPIPTPSPKVQKAIVVELERRRDGARRLRAGAQAGWAAARRAFEDALLEPAKP